MVQNGASVAQSLHRPPPRIDFTRRGYDRGASGSRSLGLDAGTSGSASVGGSTGGSTGSGTTGGTGSTL